MGSQSADEASATDVDVKPTPDANNAPDNGNTATNEKPLERVESGKPYSAFTSWQKKFIVLSAAITAFFSPLSAQIYLPALTPIAHDLNVTSTQINLTITTYMIFQGISPMFIGSLADTGGRRPAYLFCFVVYIAANIGLALAPSYGAVLGLRCLQSAGSSSTVALCTAVVADVVTSAERGQYIGFLSLPIVLAPSLGPVLGGVLSQYLGWRSIFWFLAIFAGVIILIVAMFFPETCRQIVGDGSVTPPAIYLSGWQMLNRKLQQRSSPDAENQLEELPKRTKFKPPNILGSLFMLFETETAILLWTASIVFAGFYSVAAAIPTEFKRVYGLTETQIGLMYLPMALGSIIAAVIVGPTMNRRYKAHCVKLDLPYDRKKQIDMTNFPIEKVRMEVGWPLLVLAGVAMIGWGWSIEKQAHLAVPCVLSAILGVGLIGFNNTVSTLTVEIHPGKAGTATAANNLTRCLVGAGASAAIAPMMNAWGVGGAFTFYGGLYLLCLCPILAIYFHGMKWRQRLWARKAANEQS